MVLNKKDSAKTDISDVFFGYNPFGGGCYEAIGIDKASFPHATTNLGTGRFKSEESTLIESEFDNKLKRALQKQL